MIGRAARPNQNVAQTGACRLPPIFKSREAESLPKLCREPTDPKDCRLPYIDINPHKSRPKWMAYLGLAGLLAATIAIVIFVLTTSQ